MSNVRLEIGVLNIAMHNHDQGKLSYEKLFKALYERKDIEARIDETHAACIGELDTEKKHGEEPYFLGQIYKYAKIDTEKDCLNTKTMKEATPKEKELLVIPHHLRPHFVKIPFVFIPKGHRLYVQTKHKNRSLGITRVKKILESLVTDEYISKEFGVVEVTIQPDSEAVEQLLKRKDIDKLIVDMVRPNPDDLKSQEEAIFERMKERNLKRQKSEYTSNRSESLNLDKDLKLEIKIASSNGKVIAEGTNAKNKKWKISTEDTNLIIKASYNSDLSEENRGKDLAEECLIETSFDNHENIIK